MIQSSNNIKKVKFSLDTKIHDGSTKKLLIFRKIVLNFLLKRIKRSTDILKILKKNSKKYNIEVLNFIVDEIIIIKYKLEDLLVNEIFNNVFDEIENNSENDPYWGFQQLIL